MKRYSGSIMNKGFAGFFWVENYF